MFTLIEQIKIRTLQARKDRDSVTANVLNLVIGHTQLTNDTTDNAVVRFISKLSESIAETIKIGGETPQLKKELSILEPYLPQHISINELIAYAKTIRESIVGAKANGQAIGLLSKQLKVLGLTAKGDDMLVVVNAIRSQP